MTDKGCPAKKISSFAEQNASLCDPSHPPGDNCWAFPLVLAGSQSPKLSTTTLHDGAPLPPPSLLEHRMGLPAGYRRHAGENVLAQSRHRSQKSRHILASNAREMPPACTCYLKVFSITGLELQQLDCRVSQNILSQ